MHKKKSEGFILVLVLLICSVLIIIGTQLYYKSTSNTILSTTMLKREKAKVLALSGIELAKNYFIFDDSEESEQSLFGKSDKAKESKDPKTEYYRKLFLKLYAKINVWQEYKFKDGSMIKFCITCEDGKININEFFDFEKNKFKSPQDEQFFKKIAELIGNSSDTAFKFSDLQSYLSKRKFPLNDTTELLSASGFDYFIKHVFYTPLENKDIYLTDIFTTFSSSKNIQPIFMSNSLSLLAGFKSLHSQDLSKAAQLAPEAVKHLKQKINWATDWKNLAELKTGKKYESILPELSKLFEPSFTPENFSVISYGIVDGVEQKIYAILHFDKIKDKVILTLKRLYWI